MIKSGFIGSEYFKIFWIVVSCLALYFFFFPTHQNSFLAISSVKSVNRFACSSKLSIRVKVILLKSLVWSVKILCLSSTVAFKFTCNVSVVFLTWLECSFSKLDIFDFKSAITLSIRSKYFSRICSILGFSWLAVFLCLSTCSSSSIFNCFSIFSTLFEKSINNFDINDVRSSFVLFTSVSFLLTLAPEISFKFEFKVSIMLWMLLSNVLEVSVKRFVALSIRFFFVVFFESESSKNAVTCLSTAFSTSPILLSWIASSFSKRSDWSAKILSLILAISFLKISDSLVNSSKYGWRGIYLSTRPSTLLRKPFSTNQFVTSNTLS